MTKPQPSLSDFPIISFDKLRFGDTDIFDASTVPAVTWEKYVDDVTAQQEKNGKSPAPGVKLLPKS